MHICNTKHIQHLGIGNFFYLLHELSNLTWFFLSQCTRTQQFINMTCAGHATYQSFFSPS